MVKVIKGEELMNLYKSKLKQRVVPFTKYDDNFRQSTPEEKIEVVDTLTELLNLMNGNIYTGKHYIARKSEDKMVQRVVYNRIDSLKSLVTRAEVAISKGEEVPSDVMDGLNLWEGTKQYRKGGWNERVSGEYKEGYKNYEWEVTGLLSHFNTGLQSYSYRHIGWLGGDEDQYYTPHIFNVRKGRTSDAVEYLTCLYVDIDGVTVDEAEQRLSKSGLPKPTLAVNSGGGVHYYWVFNRPAQANGDRYCFINTWRKLATHFTKQLDGDLQCVDVARLLRIPGTINTKYGVKSEILYFNGNTTYNIMDLHRKYNVPQARKINTFTQVKGGRVATKQVVGDTKTQSKPTLTPRRDYEQETDNTSGYNRQVKDDLLTLTKLRDGDVEGHRHTLLFYYKRFGATLTELEGMNNLFIQPVPHNDVLAVSKSKWLVGKRPKRVTMMERLNITVEESSHMQQLVPADVVRARQELRKLSDGYSKVFNAYNYYLQTLYSQVDSRTTTDKASMLSLTPRQIQRLKKVKLSSYNKTKRELVDSLVGLIEIAVDVVEVIELSVLNDEELGSYYDEIVGINNSLLALQQVLEDGKEVVNGVTRIKKLEAKIKQMQTLAA